MTKKRKPRATAVLRKNIQITVPIRDADYFRLLARRRKTTQAKLLRDAVEALVLRDLTTAPKNRTARPGEGPHEHRRATARIR